ncbi:MAG: hypothetical protein ACRD2G_12210, partial [Terriglobia bacterium]
MKLHSPTAILLIACGAFAAGAVIQCGRQQTKQQAKSAPESQGHSVHLSTTKLLDLPAPGHPQKTNSFPTALALSPDGQYVAVLNNGYGTAESSFEESIAVLNLSSNQLQDFPDKRLARSAQTYFLGLVFSSDGHR